VCFYKPCTFGCVWKWIRSRKQDSVPESGPASLYSAKIIKISRLTIDHWLILWSLHRSLRCCETHCTNFLPLDTQDVERGELRYARNCARNCDWNSLRFLTAPICSRDDLWVFYLRLIVIMRILLIKKPTHRVPTLRGTLWTILKTSHWLSDAFHVKQDDLIGQTVKIRCYLLIYWYSRLMLRSLHSER